MERDDIIELFEAELRAIGASGRERVRVWELESAVLDRARDQGLQVRRVHVGSAMHWLMYKAPPGQRLRPFRDGADKLCVSVPFVPAGPVDEAELRAEANDFDGRI